jgi:hypothetical protein
MFFPLPLIDLTTVSLKLAVVVPSKPLSLTDQTAVVVLFSIPAPIFVALALELLVVLLLESSVVELDLALTIPPPTFAVLMTPTPWTSRTSSTPVLCPQLPLVILAAVPPLSPPPELSAALT